MEHLKVLGVKNQPIRLRQLDSSGTHGPGVTRKSGATRHPGKSRDAAHPAIRRRGAGSEESTHRYESRQRQVSP